MIKLRDIIACDNIDYVQCNIIYFVHPRIQSIAIEQVRQFLRPPFPLNQVTVQNKLNRIKFDNIYISKHKYQNTVGNCVEKMVTVLYYISLCFCCKLIYFMHYFILYSRDGLQSTHFFYLATFSKLLHTILSAFINYVVSW